MDEIFRMTLGSDESLEHYEERFQLNYKRANCTLDPDSLKLVLLRGIREEMIHLGNFEVYYGPPKTNVQPK